MINTSAPGKIIVAGEWAVLEKGNSAVVAAVNNKINVKIRESDRFLISIKDYGINEQELISGSRHMSIAFSAVKTLEEYLGNLRPCHIVSEGIDRIGGHKIGLGSSAAATAAIVTALLEYNDSAWDKQLVYKLSMLSHFGAQGKLGSGTGIAASVYGGTVKYTAPDTDWLKKRLGKKKTKEIVSMDWPDLKIENISLMPNLKILIGFTGSSASTKYLIKKIMDFKQSAPDEYTKIMTHINEQALIFAVQKNEQDILSAIRNNSALLRRLENKSGVNIFTKELTKLIELSSTEKSAAKLSGAGGGDCGIAVCFDEKITQKIKRSWEENKIVPLDLKIDTDGIKLNK
ncbi:MAG: phosphomevalonate kinase [Nanoarchaeota archaeon]|nr:phosphomevalonate kinase [Nanoarchaeota archaeon]